MRELPGWVRWLLVGRFVNALGSMAWVSVPLYLVSDRGLDAAAAGSIVAVWGVWNGRRQPRRRALLVIGPLLRTRMATGTASGLYR